MCFLIAGFGQGGAQKQSILLMNELQKRDDVELHLIYSYEDVNFPDLVQDSIQLHKINIASAYNPRNVVRVGRVLKSISPDIAFSWLHAFDVYTFFSRKFVPNCKWVVAERDSYYPFDPRYLLRGILCAHADMIVSNSDKGRLYWQEKTATVNLPVVSNILSVKTGQVVYAVKGSPTVLYAGRFEAQKNVVNVLRAFIELAKVYPAGRFVLIGSGSLQVTLEKILYESGVSKQIIILPFKKNIADYFETADVFVNVSLHEGMPNTVIENLALSKVVVVSEIDEHTKLLGRDYPFYVRDLEDVSEIVEVINMAALDECFLSYLQYGKNKLAGMTSEKVCDSYVKLFKEVAGV